MRGDVPGWPARTISVRRCRRSTRTTTSRSGSCPRSTTCWPPIHNSVDNLASYLDPWFAPDDFVDWLAEWVGAVIDGTWDLDRRRASVAHATELYGMRGTARGLAAQIELVTGGTVEIVENGAAAWTLNPSEPMPGTAQPSLTVRVSVADPSAVDAARLDRLVNTAKPAHVPHTIEVRAATAADAGTAGGKAPRRSAGTPPTASGPTT